VLLLSADVNQALAVCVSW